MLVRRLLLLGDVRQVRHGVRVVLGRGRLLLLLRLGWDRRRRLWGLLLGTSQCVLELRLRQTLWNGGRRRLSMTSLLSWASAAGDRLGQVQTLSRRFIVQQSDDGVGGHAGGTSSDQMSMIVSIVALGSGRGRCRCGSTAGVVVIHHDSTVLRPDGAGIDDRRRGRSWFTSSFPGTRTAFLRRSLQRGMIQIVHTNPTAPLERFRTLDLHHLEPLIPVVRILSVILGMSHNIYPGVSYTHVHRVG